MEEKKDQEREEANAMINTMDDQFSLNSVLERTQRPIVDSGTHLSQDISGYCSRHILHPELLASQITLGMYSYIVRNPFSCAVNAHLAPSELIAHELLLASKALFLYLSHNNMILGDDNYTLYVKYIYIYI